MRRNYKSDVNTLIQQRKQNPALRTLRPSHGHWTLIACPTYNEQKTEVATQYYVTNNAASKTTPSGQSCIRQAYRIDPNTGEIETKITDSGEEKQLFVVKEFTGDKDIAKKMAEQEAHALHKLRFGFQGVVIPTEESPTDEKPLVISDHYPGQAACSTYENSKDTFIFDQRTNLTFLQRLDIITQLLMQFHRMHNPLRGNPMAHVDVKGENTLISLSNKPVKHFARNEAKETRVAKIDAVLIDLGSALELKDNEGKNDESQASAQTSLSGLSAPAIPPEAIKGVNFDKTEITLGEISGTLSTASDIYALAPLFAAILGGKAPYRRRQGDIKCIGGNEEKSIKIDIVALDKQIDKGFVLDDIEIALGSSNQFYLTHDIPCAITDKRIVNAPKDQAILADLSIPLKGFVCYKSNLLYVDKLTGKVEGRQLDSRDQVSKWDNITAMQKPEEYLQKETGISHQKNIPITALLHNPIINFLNKMAHKEENQRPSTEQVLRFFTAIRNILAIASHKETLMDINDEENLSSLERKVQIELIKIYLIMHNDWDNAIEVTGITDDKPAPTTFESFDFDSMMEEKNENFSTLWNFYANKEQQEQKQKVAVLNFPKIKIESAVKRIEISLYQKLREAKAVYEQDDVIKALKSLNQKATAHNEKDSKYFFEHYASMLLSLSPRMIQYLIGEDSTQQPFPSSFILESEFASPINKEYIQECFPNHFNKIRKTVSEQKTESINEINNKHPRIAALLRIDLNEEAQVKQFLDENFGSEREASFQDKCFDFLNTLRENEMLIQQATSPQIYNRLIATLTTPMLKEATDYQKRISGFKDTHYQKCSFFGPFGFSIGKKKAAVEAFITAITTGKYKELLYNKAVIPALRQKNLGGISSTLLKKMQLFVEQEELTPSKLTNN